MLSSKDFQARYGSKAKKKLVAERSPSGRELMSLEVEDASEALSAITINARAEHVEYGINGKFIDYVLKSNKRKYRISLTEIK